MRQDRPEAEYWSSRAELIRNFCDGGRAEFATGPKVDGTHDALLRGTELERVEEFRIAAASRRSGVDTSPALAPMTKAFPIYSSSKLGRRLYHDR